MIQNKSVNFSFIGRLVTLLPAEHNNQHISQVNQITQSQDYASKD